jgi:sulfite exporter TauE/SafE
MSLAMHLGTAALLGASSSAHCVGMCGPLVAPACSVGGSSVRSTLGYFIGRTFAYAWLGALAGTIGRPLAEPSISRAMQAIAAGSIALLLLMQALRRALPRPPRLLQLGPPRSAWARSIAQHLPRRGLGLGLATGLFPCGALAGGVLAAAASASSLTGALMRGMFALASAPALVAALLVGGATLRNLDRLRGTRGRVLSAGAMTAAAVWIAASPWIAGHASPGHPACACHAQAEH